MKNLIKIKDKCVGCGACKNSCSNNAIEMAENEYGFLYPVINETLCNKCGLCEFKCPVINTKETQNLTRAYYGRANNEEIVRKSSSGGIFSSLAEEILKDNGVVFGAVYDNPSKTIIYSNTKETSLDSLRRSKYSESNTKNIFSVVKKMLNEGTKVLFCGTPCHIAGLKLYLGKEYENLYTCDFICGGVPSGKYLREHLAFLEKKYKSNIVDINFRPKLFGWSDYSIKIDFKNGKSYKNLAFLDRYFRGFVYEKATVRDSCYSCDFRTNHASDVILADFWGYKQVPGLLNDEKGFSLVVTNSEKGELLLENVRKNNADLKEIPLDMAMYNFTNSKITEEQISIKNSFKVFYSKYGFEKAAKKVYMKKNKTFFLKQLIKKILK